MRILVIGSGGREHALAWRMLQDPSVESVHVFPGNPGMKSHSSIHLLPGEVSFEKALEHARSLLISLVVIGPEKFLFEGWVDQFQKHGIAAYGPSQKASLLELSKIQSKNFMKEFHIPTAGFEVTHTLEAAIQVIDQNPLWNGYVLKLSGPALGKGVIVSSNAVDAKKAAEDFFKHRPPGIEEGMVIEEKIDGREVSLFYVCSGEHFRFLASACDHKRLLDHDQGPNTGGMGAYSPCDWFSSAQLKEIESTMVKPTLQGMIQRGHAFSGTLFLGLMVCGEECFLLEYNTRFGDPETQTFLPLLKGNLSQLLLASAEGGKDLPFLEKSEQHSVHVVKAAKGYPGLFGRPIESGQKIELSPEPLPPHALLFFAGVSEKENQWVTRGGRVLGLTQIADTLELAQKQAYQNIHAAFFKNEQYRTDIALSAIQKEPT